MRRGEAVRVEPEPYPVVYAKTAPVIDGKLDDELWQRAKLQDQFYDGDRPGVKVSVAKAYLAWDEKNLYFAMEIQDKDLFWLDDPILCRSDVAELFVKHRADPFDLYEFEFALPDRLWNILYISPGGGGTARFDKFRSGTVFKTVANGTVNNWEDVDTGWTVEAAIPLTAFARVVPNGPKPGDEWRLLMAGYDFSVYSEKIFIFSTCDNLKSFAQWSAYPKVRFMAP